MNERIPLPWYVTEHGSIASVHTGGTVLRAGVDIEDLSRRHFIVRAVNSHDDLLKACEAALEVMLYKGRLAFSGDCASAGEWTAATESAVAKLEAAIAKAHDGR